MGGLAILSLLGVYFFLATKVFKVAKTTPTKVIVLLFALLIPTADAIYGRIKLQQMCKAEGGLKVYRVAHGVEGFMADGSPDIELVKNYGYQFSEGSGRHAKYDRVSMLNGKIVREENVSLKSKFKVKLTTLDNRGNLYWRQVYSVETIPNGEILATDTNIGFSGGWAERLIAAFSDSGGGSVAVCKNTGLDPQKLVITVLKHSGE